MRSIKDYQNKRRQLRKNLKKRSKKKKKKMKREKKRYPKYHFVFKTGPEGKQIKYTVSKKVAFKEKKGGSKEKKGEKEGLEQEITERFYDELKKIKSMPCLLYT